MMSVGAGSYERELRQARVGLVGAVRRLEEAMGRFEAAEVPLWPDHDGAIPPWTAAQQAVMKSAADAWRNVVNARQAYDSAARTAGHPSEWPHA